MKQPRPTVGIVPLGARHSVTDLLLQIALTRATPRGGPIGRSPVGGLVTPEVALP